MSPFNKQSFNTACLFYLLISAPAWSGLVLPQLSTELSALLLSTSLFSSITLLTYTTRPPASSQAFFSNLALNSLLIALTLLTLLATNPLSLLPTALQQAALFVTIQVTWHQKMFASLPNKKPSYYTTVPIEEQKKVNACINAFLPYLIEKKGLFPDDFYKRSYKLTPRIIQNPFITIATSTGRQDILETPSKKSPSHSPATQLTDNTRNKLAILEAFKHQVYQKSQYLQNLNHTLQQLIKAPQLTQLQQLSKQYASNLTLQSIQQVSTRMQQRLHQLPTQACAPSLLPQASTPRCAFSGITPNVPITISLRNHHDKGSSVESLSADLHTFAEILSQFCDKIAYQKGETDKIIQCAAHLTQNGRQDLGLKMQKLAQIQQVHAEKSNVIYKCIQFWPSQSHELIEALFQFGVECGSKSTNQKTCLQLAQELQLTETIQVLQRHDNTLTTSPAMKSDFIVQSKQAHSWPKIGKSLLDPDVEILDFSLNAHMLHSNLHNQSKKISTPTSSPTKTSSPNSSPFNGNKLQQQSLYNNTNLIESLRTPPTSPVKS